MNKNTAAADAKHYVSVFHMINVIINLFLIIPVYSAEIPVMAVFKSGEVFLQSGQKELPVETGQTFRVSDRIKTGNGILDIQIGTNSVVRIGKNTKFLLTKLFEENGTVKVNLNLNEGSALAKVVKKMDKGSEFKITTPTKTAGVRATQFMVQEGQDSTSKNESEKIPDGIFVKEGEVTVKAAYSQNQISVKAGEELITAQKKIQAQMLDSFMKEKLRILETLNVLQEENYKLLQEQYRKNQEILKKK